MRRNLCAGFFLLFAILVVQVQAKVLRRYIVTVDGSAEEAIIRAGGVVDRVFEVIPALAIRIPEPASKGLSRHPAVISIEPDVEVQAVGKPSWAGGWKKKGQQPPQALEWGVDRTDAKIVWSIPETGNGVKVSVLDTGIDKKHPDLKANVRGGINFVAKGARLNPAAWNDDNGHGTYVAGIIAAVDNEIGVIGVAPEASLYAVKVLDRQGRGYVSDVIAGIEWSVNKGVDVVNMSLSTQEHVQAFQNACDAAEAAGVVLIAAAGNDGDLNLDDDIDYPARYGSVIAVGATNIDDERASWSSDGLELELAAPGVDVRSTWKNGGYATLDGTSAASPHVSGTAALVLATEVPEEYDWDGSGMWEPEELRACLIDAADDLGPEGFDRYYGYGLVDAEQSVTGIQTNP